MALYKIIRIDLNGITVVEEKEFDRLGDAKAYAFQLEQLELNKIDMTQLESAIQTENWNYDCNLVQYFAEAVHTCNHIQNVPELTIEHVEDEKSAKERVQKPKGTGRVKLISEEFSECVINSFGRTIEIVADASVAFFAIITICGVIFLLIVLFGNIFSWGEKQYYYHYYSDAEQHLLNQRVDYNASVVDNFVNRIEEHKNACEMPNTNHEWGCQFNEIEAWTIHFTWYSDFVLNNLRQEHQDKLFAEKMKRAQKYMGE